MNYKISLIGDESIIINQEQKEKLEEFLEKDKKDRDDFIHFGKNQVKISSIRSILEIPEVKGAWNEKKKEQWNEENREWYAQCYKMNQLTVKEKTLKELAVRIFPGLKIEHQTVMPEEKVSLYNIIAEFFEKNPIYPRCPSYVWITLIESKISRQNGKFVGKWWDIVNRNDGAIYQWIQHQS